MTTPKTKAGMIAIVGRPNVGKSTLTNALVGEKIAIVSNKPQTTRNRICAVVDREESQFVFMDTPGLHKARTRVGEPERELMEDLRKRNIPTVLVINKIDTVEKEKLLSVIAAYTQDYQFAHVMPISAKEGDGVTDLLDLLESYLPEGPWLFPEGMTTDQPERQVCAEILREKLLLCLDKEVPHGTAVELTKFSEREDEVIECDATIYCEKESHKGIIIGKKGAMLKKISTLAREDMEKFMGTKIFLQTWVKVKENWRDNLNFVHTMGYRED